MQIEILCRPAQTAAKVTLEGGESIVAEPGAMIAMDSNIHVETTMRSHGGGGVLKAMRRLLAGESFFINTFTASSQGGIIYLSPTLPGDMVVCEMDGSKDLIVQGTSFLASSKTVELDLSWQGFTKGIFSGEGLFWIRLSGHGLALLNSFGAIYERHIEGEYIVDTGHIVAFESSLDFKIQKASKSWIGSFLSGEALVCRFQGRGKLYFQTHNPNSFGWALSPFLRER